jgi:hypothetical protein
MILMKDLRSDLIKRLGSASAVSDIFLNANITYLAGDSANYVSRSQD